MTKRYEIINHGPDNAQYFQGCGTAFTDFNEVATGIGTNAEEAYTDALEQLYMSFDTDALDACKLPMRPRGIRASDKLTKAEMENEDLYWYVSIRVKL